MLNIAYEAWPVMQIQCIVLECPINPANSPSSHWGSVLVQVPWNQPLK